MMEITVTGYENHSFPVNLAEVCRLARTLIMDEALIAPKRRLVCIPDITVEPDVFHGVNVKQLTDSQFEEACKGSVTQYVLSHFPAAGTIASNRLVWYPVYEDVYLETEDILRQIAEDFDINMCDFIPEKDYIQ